MTFRSSKIRAAVLVASGALVLSACGGTPDKVPLLDEANATYSSANEDPIVARHAAMELDDAKNWLDRANRSHKKGEKLSTIEHQAYVANKRVLIAVERSAQIEADRNIETMKVERQSVQIDARAVEANKAKAEALALQKQMQELEAIQTERGLVMTLGDVLFNSGESTLAPGAQASIVKIGDFMTQYPNKTATIEGHTDSMGSDDQNYDLSVRRANAVRQALLKQGIEGSRVITKGFGESMPVSSNDTATGRAQNRRVDIIFGESQRKIASTDE